MLLCYTKGLINEQNHETDGNLEAHKTEFVVAPTTLASCWFSVEQSESHLKTETAHQPYAQLHPLNWGFKSYSESLLAFPLFLFGFMILTHFLTYPNNLVHGFNLPLVTVTKGLVNFMICYLLM